MVNTFFKAVQQSEDPVQQSEDPVQQSEDPVQQWKKSTWFDLKQNDNIIYIYSFII